MVCRTQRVIDGKMSFFNALQILMLLTGLVLCRYSDEGHGGKWTLKEKVGTALSMSLSEFIDSRRRKRLDNLLTT
jgi:Ni,Fe-hydrogenase I cytochrome b subunit